MKSETQVRRRLATRKTANEELASIFAALGEPYRLRIFELFMDSNDLCVSDVAAYLGTSLPAASQKLRIMESAGLVVRERKGQRVCYRLALDKKVVGEMVGTVEKLNRRLA